MSVNETAEAILAIPNDALLMACRDDLEVIPGNPCVYVPHEYANIPRQKVTDLQIMARLWLLKESILTALDSDTKLFKDIQTIKPE